MGHECVTSAVLRADSGVELQVRVTGPRVPRALTQAVTLRVTSGKFPVEALCYMPEGRGFESR
jgi:hypothetical protein